MFFDVGDRSQPKKRLLGVPFCDVRVNPRYKSPGTAQVLGILAFATYMIVFSKTFSRLVDILENAQENALIYFLVRFLGAL